VSGVTGGHDTPVSAVTRSVLRPKTVGMTVRAKSGSRFLLSPEGRELAKGGGVATRFRCDRTHRTNHHNFRSPAVGERWRLHRRLQPIERRCRSAYYCFVIERRSRLQGSALLQVAKDRTEALVGKIGRRSRPGTKTTKACVIGRRSRSANETSRSNGRVDRQSRDVRARFFCCWHRSNGLVGRFPFCYDKVEREKLGGCAFAATDRGGSTVVDS
jgi:hypothetical protein